MTAVDMARSIVAERFPNVLAAMLAGSSALGTATATSDLDIVVVLDGPPAPYRETIRVRGTPVELFVHTSESLAYWFDRERGEGRCTLAHMLATGIALAGSDVDAIQSTATRWVEVGPERWAPDQLEYRRYALTDALDDLVGAVDPDERDAVAGQALVMAAELALSLRGRWLGRGKWLVRLLRDADQQVSTSLMMGHRVAVATGNVDEFVTACEAVLAEAGGRLTEGFYAR
jgi:hypothetical protein